MRNGDPINAPLSARATLVARRLRTAIYAVRHEKTTPVTLHAHRSALDYFNIEQ